MRPAKRTWAMLQLRCQVLPPTTLLDRFTQPKNADHRKGLHDDATDKVMNEEDGMVGVEDIFNGTPLGPSG